MVAATGSRILERLEAEATSRGAQKVVLNVPYNVTEFYAGHNHAVVGEAETLFGVIRHVRMVVVIKYHSITASITIYASLVNVV